MEEKQKVLDLLKQYTSHPIVELTPKGDAAIFAAIYLARDFYNKKNPDARNKVLIPDQGGWLSYKKIPGNLGLEFEEVKTKDGIIDTIDLAQKIDNKTICFIYVNPAGYFAEQSAVSIFKTCQGKCLTIMDCSGSLGTDMCNGEFADLIVGSFGRWKPVNLEYGGFVSVKEQEVYDLGRGVFDLAKFDDARIPELLHKLEQLDKRYELFEEHRKKIINDLKEFKVVYPERRGINAVVKFNSESEKNVLVKYCEDEGYEYTVCPRYIRLESPAISIEVKRLK